MGSLVFDILHDTPFFDEQLLADDFRHLSDEEVCRALDSYRSTILKNLDVLRAEAQAVAGPLTVLANSRTTDLRLLSQCAWYVHCFVVNDPLFVLTRPCASAQGPMEEYLGLKKADLDRRALVRAAHDLKALQPMVAADYVKLLPLSFFFEPPSELPISYSATGFSDALPSPIMEWFKSRARVLPVELKDGLLTMPLSIAGVPQPRRRIAIHFGEAETPYIYQLFEQQVLSVDESRQMVKFSMVIPETPPSKAYFEAWVAQSIHQAARSTYEDLVLENALASSVGAQYLTTSNLAADLMSLSVAQKDIPTSTLASLVDLELPLAPEVDIGTIMRVRTGDGEAFAAFRIELERHLRDLELSAPDAMLAKARNAVHELTEVQVAAIDRDVSRLRTKGVLSGVAAVASLASSVVTGGWSLIGLAAAVAKGADAVDEYYKGARKNGAFFLWKVMRESKRRGA